MKNNFFVIDTNTLISAFLFNNSTTTVAFDKARKLGGILASAETFEEFRTVFLRPKFDKYVSLETRLEIISALEEVFVFREILERVSECRDPKDNKFLELAICANAACIITGDKDLLVLHPFRDIPILNAIDFINNTSQF